MHKKLNIFALDTLIISSSKELIFGKEANKKFELIGNVPEDIKEELRQKLYSQMYRIYNNQDLEIVSLKGFEIFKKDNSICYELSYIIIDICDNKEKEVVFNYSRDLVWFS